ncbi:recombinase family protein [Rhodococcus erythropolis]|uniref:recombinase family protein n=1 Tax=Rhodococcus erythropolis TaxID=1833 RepID=UPI002949AC2A|nr:recombinase family protein [Rhodococcus erythropolis]MDV6274040.1 recombinase family protein [Rhodococcus erythropolis]
MRAVIYTRVSSDAAGKGRSVSEQEVDCREICEREGWDVAEVLTDNDIGASRHSVKDRPAYRRLSEVLTKGDVLVMWEASRAQRDMKAYVELRDLCADRGVFWSYSGRLYDPSRGDDRFSTGLDALLAEKEAEQTRERVLRAKRSAALEGRPLGRLSYGYRRQINMRTGATEQWILDESEAPIVREIYDRVLDGESLWAITRDLTARGVPAPSNQKNAAGEWKAQRMRVMILRPAYAGLMVHKGKVIGKANWEAIATEQEHQRLVAILTDPARATHRGCEPRHLLTGIATCGVCGSGCRYFHPKSSKSPRYVCEKKNCVTRRTDEIEEFVTEGIIELASNPEHFAALNASNSPEGRAAFDEASALSRKLDTFLDEAADQDMNPIDIARYSKKMRERIAAAEDRARASLQSPLLAKLSGLNAREQWGGFAITARREVVRALVQVTINRSTVGTRRFTHADIDYNWLI